MIIELFPSNNIVNLEEKMSYEKIIDEILQVTDKNQVNYNIDKTYKDFVYKSLLTFLFLSKLNINM